MLDYLFVCLFRWFVCFLAGWLSSWFRLVGSIIRLLASLVGCLIELVIVRCFGWLVVLGRLVE